MDLTAAYSDPENDPLTYTWSVTGGTLSGEGRSVSWDLGTLSPGTYTATVSVSDGAAPPVTWNGHGDDSRLSSLAGLRVRPFPCSCPI